jgi:hypothetical protein
MNFKTMHKRIISETILYAEGFDTSDFPLSAQFTAQFLALPLLILAALWC